MKLTPVRSIATQSSQIILKSEKPHIPQLSVHWHVVDGKLICRWVVN